MTICKIKFNEMAFNEMAVENLKKIRESRNIDPDEFAFKLGISGRILKEIEEGQKEFNDFIDIHCIVKMQNEFGKNIINELFKGINELFHTAIKLNALEQNIINNVRQMPSDKERKFIAWLSEIIAGGVIKVT